MVAAVWCRDWQLGVKVAYCCELWCAVCGAVWLGVWLCGWVCGCLPAAAAGAAMVQCVTHLTRLVQFSQPGSFCMQPTSYIQHTHTHTHTTSARLYCTASLQHKTLQPAATSTSAASHTSSPHSLHSFHFTLTHWQVKRTTRAAVEMLSSSLH